MEENLEPINEVNKEVDDNTKKPNIEKIEVSKSEKIKIV